MKRVLLIFIMTILSFPVWSVELQYLLRVDGLACPYCAYGIEKKVKTLDGVEEESIEIRLNEGVVAFNANTQNPIEEQTLKKLVNDAGFTLRGYETQQISTSK